MAEPLSRSIWSWLAVAAVVALAAAPALLLVFAMRENPSPYAVWTPSFARAAAGSLLLALGVITVSLMVGMPLGLLSGLYRFPGRFPLLVAQALPLLLPSFLPAIGWSNLAASGWLPRFLSPDGLPGAVFVLGLQAVPLPLLATWAACRNLTASQIEAARLHGGERTVLARSAGACAPVAVLAALLAGILSLSDAGAPLILGCRCVAVEIRTSFAAYNDYDLAARQCLALAAVVLLLTVPVLALGLRRLASAVLARQTRAAAGYRHARLSRCTLAGLIAVVLLGTVLPAFGLCLPAIHSPALLEAANKLRSCAAPSLIYSGGAGLAAVLLGVVVALVSARSFRLKLLLLAALLTLFALPPAMGAIGVSYAATKAPARWDWLTRGQLTVAAVLGLRFLAVATVVVMRGVGSLSPSWIEAARLHGVSRLRLLLRVILPLLLPSILIAGLLVMVLASADVTTAHLLAPPGRRTLSVAIFTVMANSPEGLVAWLCLLYLSGVACSMAVASQLPRCWSRRSA